MPTFLECTDLSQSSVYLQLKLQSASSETPEYQVLWIRSHMVELEKLTGEPRKVLCVLIERCKE